MNKCKILIILLVFFCTCFSSLNEGICGDIIYVEPNRELIQSSSNLGSALGSAIHKWRRNKKLRKYIESCNDPLLNSLPPEDAMKVILDRGIKCSGINVKRKEMR